MLIAGLTADVFATNCYVLAGAAGGPCVIVDPGFGIVETLGDLLAEHALRPEAVLLTHGHVDHTASAGAVGDRWGVPVYIHPADRGQLVDPASGIPADLGALFGEDFIWDEPELVVEYPVSGPIHVADLDILVDHAPGHTPGAVLLRVQGGAGCGSVCLAGDVLFAGSVGRTDLPGGDPGAMRATLRDKIVPLADDTTVLPGHGPRTTIGRERAANPFLRAAARETKESK